MGLNICTYKTGPNSHKLASAHGGAPPGPLPANLPKITVQIRASSRPKKIYGVN